MNKIEFLVQGSEPEPYKVVFQKTDKGFTATCNCTAAVNGRACKHRTRIMEGSTESIVSKNTNQVEEVSSWFKNSDVEEKMAQIGQKEKQILVLKKEIQVLKKNMAQLMRKAA